MGEGREQEGTRGYPLKGPFSKGGWGIIMYAVLSLFLLDTPLSLQRGGSLDIGFEEGQKL